MSARWPLGIAALLGVAVSANGLLLVLALRDPAFAVEPRAYDQGNAWDARRAAARESAALGWTATIVRESPLTVRIADGQGAALAGAAVRFSGERIGRAEVLRERPMEAGSAGEYVLPDFPGTRGLWEMRLEVRARDHVWTRTLRHTVGAAAAAQAAVAPCARDTAGREVPPCGR